MTTSASTLVGSTFGREASARTSAPGPGSTQTTAPPSVQTSPPEWRSCVDTANRAPAVPRNLSVRPCPVTGKG